MVQTTGSKSKLTLSAEDPLTRCVKCNSAVASTDAVLDALRIGQEALQKATSLQFSGQNLPYLYRVESHAETLRLAKGPATDNQYHPHPYLCKGAITFTPSPGTHSPPSIASPRCVPSQLDTRRPGRAHPCKFRICDGTEHRALTWASCPGPRTRRARKAPGGGRAGTPYHRRGGNNHVSALWSGTSAPCLRYTYPRAGRACLELRGT